jgi:hypothetical protein
MLALAGTLVPATSMPVVRAGDNEGPPSLRYVGGSCSDTYGQRLVATGVGLVLSLSKHWTGRLPAPSCVEPVETAAARAQPCVEPVETTVDAALLFWNGASVTNPCVEPVET